MLQLISRQAAHPSPLVPEPEITFLREGGRGFLRPLPDVWATTVVEPPTARAGIASRLHDESVIAGLKYEAIPSAVNFRQDLRRQLTEPGREVSLRPFTRDMLVRMIDRGVADNLLAHNLSVGLVEDLAFSFDDPTMRLEVVDLVSLMASRVPEGYISARRFISEYLAATERSDRPDLARQAIQITLSAQVFYKMYPGLTEQTPWLRLNYASDIFPIHFFHSEGDRITAIFPMPLAMLTGARVRYPHQDLRLAYCMGKNGEVRGSDWNNLHLLGFIPMGFPLRPAPIDRSRVKYHPAFFPLSHDAIFHLVQVCRGTTAQDRLLATLTVACCYEVLGRRQRKKVGDWLDQLFDLRWNDRHRRSEGLLVELLEGRGTLGGPESIRPVTIQTAWSDNLTQILKTIIYRLTHSMENFPDPHLGDVRKAFELLDLLEREYARHFPALMPQMTPLLRKLRQEVERTREWLIGRINGHSQEQRHQAA